MLIKRREFLTRSAILGMGAASVGVLNSAEPPSSERKRVLRAAHLTDIHVTADKKGAPEGMAAALRHAQNLPDKPELLLFGGDLIMDALNTSKEKVLAQWELWHRIFSAEVKTPYKLCLGNHDVFGWQLHNDPDIARDPDYGKAMAMRQMGFSDRCYYSFDLAGWHFVVLDSIHADPSSSHAYIGMLDEEQFGWLGRDLAATTLGTPVCVLSHIPILSPAAYFDGSNEKPAEWIVPGAWMHIDARRIKDLFYRHPNVKVCLSGHLHLEDAVTYLGVRYCCNGAVCGNWWNGKHQEFGPIYGVLDFYNDGSFEQQLISYQV